MARSVNDYKGHLAACDEPRRNDLDGRGTLSEEALAAFTRYFLQVCLDQVDFMQSLLRPDGLRARLIQWTREEMTRGTLPAKSDLVLDAVLHRSELPRGEVDAVTGTGDRQARRIVAALEDQGALGSATPRGPLRVQFPARLADRWLPGLFRAWDGD